MVNPMGVGERVYSDCLDDVCQVICSLCGNRSTRPRFNIHWQSEHRESKEKNAYTYSKLVYHKCKLCSEDILNDVIQLQDHITKRHKMETNLLAYKEQFLTGDFPGVKRKLEYHPGNIKIANATVVKKPKLTTEVKKIVNTEVKKIVNTEVKKYVNEEDKKYEGEWESLDLEETDFETSDVHKMCLARCAMCQKITLLHHIQLHLHTCHGIVYKDESERNKNRFQIVRQTYYRCRLCWKKLLFSFHPLYVHLRDEHYVSLGDYKERYLGYNKDSYLYQKPVHNFRTIDESSLKEEKCSLRDFLGMKKEEAPNVSSSRNTSDNCEAEASAYSYLCPIKGCGMRMRKQDLQNGLGANHMKLTHDLRPYKMKRLNLKWLEIVEEVSTKFEIKQE